MKKEKSKELKRKIKASAIFIGFMALLLIVSTYAWFSSQNDVNILNLNGKVEAVDRLEISLDAKSWTQELDLSQLSIDKDAYTGHNNIQPTDLTPVSTLGTTGGKIMTMLNGTGDKDSLNDIVECIEDTTIKRSSATYPGYFAFDLFLKNTSRTNDPNTLFLITEKSTVTVLEPVNVFSVATNDAVGLQNTVRVGIAQYSGTAAAKADQATILAATNGAASVVNKVAIWEPNSNFHVDQIVKNNNKIMASNPSSIGLTTDGKFTRTSQIATYALTAKAKGTSLTNVYDWTSANDKVAKQNALQTTIEVPTDGSMPTSYIMKEKDPLLVEASDGQTAFSIPANKVIKTRVYIWLEGQDVDCINCASEGGGIEVNLGLMKNTPDM